VSTSPCVEIATVTDAVLIRDCKDHGAGPALRISYPEWHDFLSGTTGGEGLTISHHDRVTGHDGTWVHTSWHLRDRGGMTLHFTDHEWTQFWRGVLDSEEELFNSLLLS
jgi:hypothetical protein